MKKIVAICLGMLLLAGCSWINNQAEQNPPSNKNMICAQLSHQLNFQQTSPNMEYSSGNAFTKQNQLLKQYRKFGCDKLDTKNSK